MLSREAKLLSWLSKQLKTEEDKIDLKKLATDDASFRKYYRLHHLGNSLIVMDSDPTKESNLEFVSIAKRFIKMDLNVPKLFATNLEDGFMVLSDLGDDLYLDHLTVDNASKLYSDAMNAVIKMQLQKPTFLNPYTTKKILRELNLFNDWFIEKNLNLNLSYKENKILDEVYNLLIMRTLEQPQVIVHKDFHSRNLLICKDNNPGVIDFQDAIVGPITYDIASLFRDCYIDWPERKIYTWVKEFKDKLHANNLLDNNISEEQFIYWFDMTTLQRLLKNIGIFSRLNIRDNKPQYLQCYPRMFAYLTTILGKYKELERFNSFVADKILTKEQQAKVV